MTLAQSILCGGALTRCCALQRGPPLDAAGGAGAGAGAVAAHELSPESAGAGGSGTSTLIDSSGALVGLLNIRPVVLSGPDEQASLVLRHRYAATISIRLTVKL